MAVETPPEPAAALAGLDQLELAPPQQAKRHIGAKIWAVGLAQAAGAGYSRWSSGS